MRLPWCTSRQLSLMPPAHMTLICLACQWDPVTAMHSPMDEDLFEPAPVLAYWTPPSLDELTPRSNSACHRTCDPSFPIRLRTWLRGQLDDHADWSFIALDEIIIATALQLQGYTHDGLHPLHLSDVSQSALNCPTFTTIERAFLHMLLDKGVMALREWTVIQGPTAKPLSSNQTDPTYPANMAAGGSSPAVNTLHATSSGSYPLTADASRVSSPIDPQTCDQPDF